MPADLAVIGLGHLGLPLAQAAVSAGIETVGYDSGPTTDSTLTAAEIRRMSAAASASPPTPPNSAGSAPP